MREIKFRGKRVDNGEWVQGHYFSNAVNLYSCGEVVGTKDKHYVVARCHEDFSYEHTFEVYPETIGQYTGLKDKHGVEIYEGDILTSDAYPFKTEGKFNYNAEVVFFDNCPTFGYIMRAVNPDIRGISDGIGEMFDNNGEGECFEVIGNIHDNPELLKS